MTSPNPSIRHISSKRVNAVSFDRQSLLDRESPQQDYSGITNSLSPRSFSSPPTKNIAPALHRHLVDTADVESVVYRSTPTVHHSSSLHYVNPPPPGSDSTSPSGDYNEGYSDYMPATTRHLENLEWNDILPYYLPCMSWIKEYNFRYFVGDLIGGLTLVFFQLPLSLSYATTLAKVPVLSGLLSLGVTPLIYAVFGSVPQMVVGPEGPISLIVGQAVEPLLHHSNKKHLDPLEFVVAITFVSGASLLGFGLGRFGFLDNVLSASLLKGFISGVGIVMVINASIVVCGLEKLLQEIADDPNEMDIHSPFDKVRFFIHHYQETNPLTFKISMTGFVIIMALRIFKKYADKRPDKRFRNAAYIPEILLVVSISTYLCSKLRWDLDGISIIGKIKNDGSVKLYNPFSKKILPLYKTLSTSGFLCAMLGFFESTTASKSLGSTYDLPISSNRELVALGFINIVASSFGGLPSFGGYGRSKINAMSAKTTMSGAIMGICTLFTVFFLLDYLYFVPECMLSVITAVIGISLIEEAPYELYFHWQSGGYNELITFAVTVMTTLFFSMEGGIAVGLVYSLIRVIRHSAESRIQILGRYPGSNTFLDADIPDASLLHLQLLNSQLNVFADGNFTHLNTHVLEEIEGCLIIKIPEPLTFTNSSDLRTRLQRVEMYGSTKAHPASKRSRSPAMTKYIIFDLHGMTDIDSSAAKILTELLTSYKRRNIHSFFVRVNKNARLRIRLRKTGIVQMLLDDLEDVKYFEAQKRSVFSRMRGRRSFSEISAEYNEEEIANIPVDLDDTAEIYDLIESNEEPYFNHISDALKVIDFYEVNECTRTSEYLEVDQMERRSSLPEDILV
ncbi:Putative sulfate transporter [Scheffersomyces stipitis CBS 6054]|uniref:Putative sulfate transporter n=1 Tax=Scheffersomyces stipitis (strain ATCC 58785 / CBS 6054 / NBRC 10063 / NRRL Y-11545) TaxID=322104 RepID=A3LWN7_PICST|nr:Putative sulfate transporter [Scheffersomyces stipitis CBS 6054]ABN67313.2 Putative sulfate transporter [Scheffersomyces stipitis CBS 6054]